MPKLTRYSRQVQPAQGQNVIGASVDAMGGGGAGLQQAGADIQAFADPLIKAQQRIQTRNETVSRVRDLGDFTEFGATQFSALQQEKDISDPAVLQEYNATMRAKMDELVENHSGSDDSRMELLARLEAQQNAFVSQASAASVEAGVRRVNEAIGGQINQSAARIMQNPASFGTEVSRLFGHIDSMSSALTPSQERTYRARVMDTSVRSAVTSLLGSGAISEAEELLNTPGVSDLVTPETYGRMLSSIFDARRPGDLVKVADSSSPTGVRYVPKSQASGMPAPAPAPTAPIITLTSLGETEVAKQLGKLDAEKVVGLEERGQAAFRNKAEIQRMQAAIEGGRFRTGSFSDIRTNLGRLGDFLGLDPNSDIMKELGDPATADQFDAATNRLAVEMASSLGRVTNMSLGFIRDSLPALSRTVEGNRILLEVMDRTADREVQLASLANEFIQLHRTLRPEGRTTYFQMLRDIEEADPVVTEELRERIIEGSKNAPTSFSDIFPDKDDSQKLPEGVVLPDGWTFIRMEGNAVIAKDADGRTIRKDQ